VVGFGGFEGGQVSLFYFFFFFFSLLCEYVLVCMVGVGLGFGLAVGCWVGFWFGCWVLVGF